MKFIGRQFNLGAIKEAVRGTALAPLYWLPYTSLTMDDVVTQAKDESTIGVIEKGFGAEATTFESKGTLEGNISDLGFGLILMSTLGVDTVTTVGSETLVKDHVFTVGQSAQHPTLSISVVEPNSNSGAGFCYPLAMVDSLDIDIEVDKFCTYKAGIMANKGAALSSSTSYTVENKFRPQDGVIKIAANLAGLSAASPISIKKASISIKTNAVSDKVIGNTSPIDRLNQEFEVSGSFEMFYSDRSMIDTYLVGDAYLAMSLAFTNASKTIGSASNPTLTIRLAKVKYESVARKIDQKGIVSQTMKFTAFYDIANTEMLDITLRNTRVTTY